MPLILCDKKFRISSNFLSLCLSLVIKIQNYNTSPFSLLPIFARRAPQYGFRQQQCLALHAFSSWLSRARAARVRPGHVHRSPIGTAPGPVAHRHRDSPPDAFPISVPRTATTCGYLDETALGVLDEIGTAALLLELDAHTRTQGHAACLSIDPSKGMHVRACEPTYSCWANKLLADY